MERDRSFNKRKFFGLTLINYGFPINFVVFLVCAVATSACFAYGARSAWKQAKSLKPEELPKQNLMNGVGFAARALGLATLITVSGFGLMLLGISSAMNVNTPKQVRDLDFGRVYFEEFSSQV